MFLACEHEIIFYLTLVHKKCFASNFSLFLYQIYANKGKSSRQVSDRIYDATDWITLLLWIFLVYICMYIGNSKMHVILYVIYMCTMYHVVHQRWRSRNPGEHSYDVRFLDRQVGQATSDFTKQAYVVQHLMRVGKQVKNAQKTSDVIYERSLTEQISNS